MSRTLFVALAISFIIPACTADGDDGGGDGGVADVVPREGAWSYDEVTPLSSTCPSQLTGGQGGGSLAIDQASPTGFRITPGDATAPFRCSLGGGTFDCPERAAGTEDLRPTADAVLSFRATATGSFSSATRATGEQEATVSCTGAQCGLIATFPCQLRIGFVIRSQ